MKIFFYTDEFGELGQLSVLNGDRKVYLKYLGKYYYLVFKTFKCVINELLYFEKNNKVYTANSVIVNSVDLYDIVEVLTSMSETGIWPNSIFSYPLTSYDISKDVNITSSHSIIEYEDNSFDLMILKRKDEEPTPYVRHYDDEPTDIGIKESIKKRILMMIEKGLLSKYPAEDYIYWITGLTTLDKQNYRDNNDGNNENH